jgi:hypothetical protein
MFSKKILPVFAALLLTLAVSPSVTAFAAAGVPDSSEIMARYRQVCQNKIPFFSTDENKEVYLKDFSYWSGDALDNPLRTENFSIVDLDGDKVPELVLGMTTGFDGSWEVLRYEGGKIYGYNFVYRAMTELKKDGTTYGSSGADAGRIYRLRFDGAKSESIELAKSDSNKFYIGNKQVTKDKFDDYLKELWAKEDVERIEFTEENLAKKLK